MVYGSTSTPLVGAERQSRARLAAVAGLAVCCMAVVAILSRPTGLPHVATFSHVDTASHLLQKWGTSLAAIEKAQSKISELRGDLAADSVSLPRTEKSSQNTCLNHVLKQLTDDMGDEETRNRGVIGDAFKDEKTGKDDYANARNKEALKDDSYKPVAVAKAEVSILSSFMHSNEVVEASKWAEALDTTSDSSARALKLLAPSAGTVKAATAFVEEVKEDFPDLVKKCYVADCPPGKGLEKLEHGAECNSCVAGETFNSMTDDQPCMAVLASCPAGHGYAESLSKESDASCSKCARGTFSSADDADACTPHAITSCPAGEQLTAGTASTDGSCAACPDGTFKSTAGAGGCTSHSVASCPAGQEEAAGTAVSDTSCVACATGTFSTGGGTTCSAHGSSDCGPGYYHITGDASSDHTCDPCPAGRFKSGAAHQTKTRSQLSDHHV